MIRRFLLVLLLLGIGAASATGGQPNVVLILVDNQGYFELACKGNPYLRTPHIDEFARQGVDLCNFHAENFCSPSRAALLTGRQPMRYGVHNTVGGVSLLSPEETTLADRLRAIGYRTGVFGKWHLGMSHPYHPSLRGFDESFIHGGGGIGQLEDFAGNRHMNAHFQYEGKWIETSGFSTDVLFDRALEFIEASNDQPFFCFIPTPAVHFPVQAEPEALTRIQDRGVTPEQANLSLLSMVENIDVNLGRLLQRLDELKLRDDTLVVFMTDQGVGDRGSPTPVWSKSKELGGASEGKHRVFCMMQKPGLTVAGENQALACIRDLCPTILDFCGAEIPSNLDGRSLMPLLEGDAEWHDDRVIVMQCPRGRDREKWKHASVKQGPWRLVSDNRLYNVQVDSLMENDVSGEHPQLVQKLEAAYEKFWNSLPPQDDLIQRHVIGAKEAPKTLLCAMDWREGDAPWAFTALRDGFRAQGAWYVNVARSGRYRVTLRRSMKETPLPIGAVQAKVSVGPFTSETTVSVNDTQAIVELDLETGNYPLQSSLQGPEKAKGTWGALFAEVEWLNGK